jgi:hypothetical protein
VQDVDGHRSIKWARVREAVKLAEG